MICHTTLSDQIFKIICSILYSWLHPTLLLPVRLFSFVYFGNVWIYLSISYAYCLPVRAMTNVLIMFYFILLCKKTVEGRYLTPVLTEVR